MTVQSYVQGGVVMARRRKQPPFASGEIAVAIIGGPVHGFTGPVTATKVYPMAPALWRLCPVGLANEPPSRVREDKVQELFDALEQVTEAAIARGMWAPWRDAVA